MSHTLSETLASFEQHTIERSCCQGVAKIRSIVLCLVFDRSPKAPARLRRNDCDFAVESTEAQLERSAAARCRRGTPVANAKRPIRTLCRRARFKRAP